MLNKNLISNYITPLNPAPTSLKKSGKLDGTIKCILFDIYGTLFISGSGDIGIAEKESHNIRRLEQLLLKYGIKRKPHTILDDLFSAIKKKHDEMRGKGIDFPEVEIDSIWSGVLGNNNLDVIRSFAVEFEMLVNPVYPMPHARELLSECKNSKLLMGIISNAQFYTPYLFKWLLGSDMSGLGFHHDLIIFSYKFGYAKPSTFLFQHAAERLKNMNIKENSVLYIGNDMLKDIYPAKKTGFKTALFAGDSRSLRLREDDPKCKNLSADIILTDLTQLFDFVNELPRSKLRGI
ncbi:MAG: HAD family hydrolase [Proteobacteria bacterium]|nr:HAD family hydrolase [Pseudomonadota bacterium]MBU4288871.1 HAD family hydrolase [Pseudomonadota bacterium]MCG2758573.1 HAD family hydrolase [Desulfobacteraceae bacterium]